MKFYTIIIVLLALWLAAPGHFYAQTNDPTLGKSPSGNLEAMRLESQDLVRRVEDMEMKFNNKSDELTNGFNGQSGKLELRFDELALQQRNNYLNLLMGGALAVLALLGGWLWLVRYVLKQSRKSLEEMVQQKVHEKVPEVVEAKVNALVQSRLPEQVEKVLMANRQRFMDMLGEYDREAAVKNTMKLALVASNTDSANELKSLLEKWGFQPGNLALFDFESASKEKGFDGFDLVLVDNLNKQLEITKIEEMVSRPGQSNLYLYHGFGHFNNLDPYAFRINFANTRFTLYPRLMETLLYKRLFLDSPGSN